MFGLFFIRNTPFSFYILFWKLFFDKIELVEVFINFYIYYYHFKCINILVIAKFHFFSKRERERERKDRQAL